MTRNDIRALAARVCMPRIIVGLACAIAVAGCVPIPIAQRTYVPNGADIMVSKGGSDGCTFNQSGLRSERQFGNVTVSVGMRTQDVGTPNARGLLYLYFYQKGEIDRIINKSVNPAGIKLQEGGRTRGAKRLQPTDDFPSSKNHVRLVFPAPSAVSQNVTLVFDQGAIQIDGRTVPLAPIRFALQETTAVYMFPCIPT